MTEPSYQRVYEERLNLLVQKDNITARVAADTETLEAIDQRLAQLRPVIEGIELAKREHDAQLQRLGIATIELPSEESQSTLTD